MFISFSGCFGAPRLTSEVLKLDQCVCFKVTKLRRPLLPWSEIRL